MKLDKLVVPAALVALCMGAAIMFGCQTSSISITISNPVKVETATIDQEAIASREWLPAYDTLVASALDARTRSYSPYSHYAVGAALLANDGTIVQGCNVENAAYPSGTCAEHNAFDTAVTRGIKGFKAIAIVGASDTKEGSDFCAPCGLCRQVIREFTEPDFLIILVEVDESKVVQKYKIYTRDEILPDSFGPENL